MGIFKKNKKAIEELKQEFPDLDLPENTLNRLINNDYIFTEKDVENINDVADSSELKDIDYKSRGFKTYEDAVNYVKSERFKCLEKIEQDEYLSWLNK